MAARIARPETATTLLATEASLRLAPSSTFWSGLISAASGIVVVHVRHVVPATAPRLLWGTFGSLQQEIGRRAGHCDHGVVGCREPAQAPAWRLRCQPARPH
jgi:hypothetical protein